MSNKTKSPIGPTEFQAAAAPITILIGDQKVTGEVKMFQTGSYGWYVNSRISLTIDGKPVQVQVGANLILVGSKDTKDTKDEPKKDELKKEEQAPARVTGPSKK